MIASSVQGPGARGTRHTHRHAPYTHTCAHSQSCSLEGGTGPSAPALVLSAAPGPRSHLNTETTQTGEGLDGRDATAHAQTPKRRGKGQTQADPWMVPSEGNTAEGNKGRQAHRRARRRTYERPRQSAHTHEQRGDTGGRPGTRGDRHGDTLTETAAGRGGGGVSGQHTHTGTSTTFPNAFTPPPAPSAPFPCTASSLLPPWPPPQPESPHRYLGHQPGPRITRACSGQ